MSQEAFACYMVAAFCVLLFLGTTIATILMGRYLLIAIREANYAKGGGYSSLGMGDIIARLFGLLLTAMFIFISIAGAYAAWIEAQQW